MLRVPNLFPTKPTARRLALIAEAPGVDEAAWHVCPRCGHGFSSARSFTGSRCPNCSTQAEARPTPFVGNSGRLLWQLLAAVGIERETCFVGNCAQVQPPGNKIELFKWDGPELTAGMAQLRADLAAYQPHMILMLGNTPLRHLTGDRRRNISDWRGSLMTINLANGGVVNEAGLNPSGLSTLVTPTVTTVDYAGSNPATAIKALATYHPAALLPGRTPELTGVVQFDLRRLAEELPTDELVFPQRNITIAHPDEGWTPGKIMAWAQAAIAAGTPLSTDIEGVVDYVECIGFAPSPVEALVIPFISVTGESVWEEEDEYQVWLAVQMVLTDRRVPKILQNALYDAFVLAWSYGIVVDPIADDTMLKHHELYCEFEKSLAFQASIYTRQPFYKWQRKASKV